MTPEALIQQTDFHPVYLDGVVGNELAPVSVKPLSVYALIANSQRSSTVKALAELARAGRIDLTILIPSGAKSEEFCSQLAAEKLYYKHAKKAEFLARAGGLTGDCADLWLAIHSDRFAS